MQLCSCVYMCIEYGNICMYTLTRIYTYIIRIFESSDAPDRHAANFGGTNSLQQWANIRLKI